MIKNVSRSPLTSTALSFFPPTAAVGLTLKAYQGFRAGSADRDALVSTIAPGSVPLVNAFFPEVLKGAATGAAAGALGGWVGAGVGAVVGAVGAAIETPFDDEDEVDDDQLDLGDEEEEDMEEEA